MTSKVVSNNVSRSIRRRSRLSYYARLRGATQQAYHALLAKPTPVRLSRHYRLVQALDAVEFSPMFVRAVGRREVA